MGGAGHPDRRVRRRTRGPTARARRRPPARSGAGRPGGDARRGRRPLGVVWAAAARRPRRDRPARGRDRRRRHPARQRPRPRCRPDHRAAPARVGRVVAAAARRARSSRPTAAGTCAGSSPRPASRCRSCCRCPDGQPPGLYALLLVGAVMLAALSPCWPPGGWPAPPPGRWPSSAGRPTGWPTATSTARVPVRGRDEVGRLAATFNRMTRETAGVRAGADRQPRPAARPPRGARRHPVQHPRPAPDPAGHPADRAGRDRRPGRRGAAARPGRPACWSASAPRG